MMPLSNTTYLSILTRVWLVYLVVLACTSVSHADTRFTLFPEKAIYPKYIADPLRATSNFQVMKFANTTIANTSDDRYGIKLGGVFLLGEWHNTKEDSADFQLVLDGGFNGQFDNQYNQDNIGWDGIYGLRLFYRYSDILAFNTGIKHISAHIGDEIAERTGRTRINYTREEFLAGLAWSLDPQIDVYFELAYAYDLRNETLQEPWRAQAGVQHQVPNLWLNRFGWYTALDVTSFEESDWDANITLQTGIYTTRNASRSWRLGLELYDGRAQLGEFFQDNERYASLGIWYDL
jgi:hypothetical protein